MSMFERLAQQPVGLRFDPVDAITGALRTIRVWNERYVQRKALAELDRRLLLDVGIDPDARAAELQKPFWQP